MSREDDDSPPSFSQQRENNYDVNSRIMLAAIFSLSFVIALVIILHIYARCVLHRRNQAALISRSAFITTTTTAHAGLDPAVVAALPSFVFKQSNIINIFECSVCLSMLEEGETARALPNCNHTFHADCIDKWFSTNTTCPICRTEAPPRPTTEPREGLAPLVEGSSAKINSIGSGSSSSRLSSFRRILNRERSSRRMQNQSCGLQEELGLPVPDVERQ